MADYYVNSNFTGTSDGSIGAPWKALSDLHNRSYTTIDNVYFAMGTTYTSTSRANILDATDLTFTTYDSGDSSTVKPIIECYISSTATGDWAEVQNDGSTPVVSAGDTNVWRLDLGTAYSNSPRFASFGILGPSGAGLRKHWFLTAYNTFDQVEIPSANANYIEYDVWRGDANLNSSLYVYCEQNPITEWGTVYYQTQQHPPFLVYLANNFVVDGLKCQNSIFLVSYQDDAGRSTSSGLVVKNCDFDFVHNTIQFGGTIARTWKYDGTIFENNTVTNTLATCIAFSGNIINAHIRNNSLDAIGLSESAGGIYFPNGTATSSTPNLVYGNTINDVKAAVYWTRDGAGLYSDENVPHTHFFRNTVTNCFAAMKDNSGVPGNKFYSNKAVNCSVLFEIGDSGNYHTATTEVYNNTLINGDQRYWDFAGVDKYYFDAADRETSAIRILGTADGNVDITNNILVSIVDTNTKNVAFYIDTSAAVTYTIVNNMHYNYTRDAQDHNAATFALTELESLNIDPQINSSGIPDVEGPCYHAGTILGFNIKDFKGHKFNIPPTIGAYEFTSRSVAKAGRNWR